MVEVQKIALEKALRTLDSLKDCIQYAVEFNGNVFGNRELLPAKPPKPVKGGKRAARYPFGVTREYYSPFFKNAKEGDVIEVPFGQFDGAVLVSNISSFCVHTFGKGSTTIHKNNKNSTVEVLIMGIPKKEEQIELFQDCHVAAD